MKLIIPDPATRRHIGFLGQNGSGKTSAAKVGIAEPALAAKERVLIIDPTGVWWGLRLKRDGIKPAYSIVIFGGDHADYPLRAKDAALLAETFGGATDSAIFDTSQMTVSDRCTFFTEFANTLLRKNRGPVKLIIDEAHLFMPQVGAKTGGQIPAMLHAGNNLVSLGRSKGIAITLISQRPAKIHKDSLTQIHALVAMRLMAPQDRAAIKEWVADQADPAQGKEIIASLATLSPGEAWIWSPQDNLLDRKKFPLPQTFDSSRAPEIGEGTGPELKPLDLDKLKDKLAVVEKERIANDPKTLRAENQRLTAEITRMRNEPKIDDGAIREAERRGYANGIAAGRRHITGVVEEIVRSTKAHAAEAERLASKAWDEALPLKQPAPLPRPTPKAAPQMPPRAKSIPQNGDAGPLPKGELAILIACAQANGASREQLTVMTGYKRSTRDAYIQRLAEKGLVSAPSGGDVGITQDGQTALPSNYEPLPTGQELLQHYINTLPSGESKCLGVISGSGAATRDEIGNLTGFKRSTRDAYLQRLSTRRLIVIDGGHITLSPTLL